jgi:hypothetical protein
MASGDAGTPNAITGANITSTSKTIKKSGGFPISAPY